MDNESHEPNHDPLWDPPVVADEQGVARYRMDGWTPFARKAFLMILADTGRVSVACQYVERSPQSAYALRARDPLFALGWDAACERARAPLADALYERALDGVKETITRDGEVVAERHRYDSRLSIAVLHRLDKRCDRAAERGSKHLAVLANWEKWVELVGQDQREEARAMLELDSQENAGRHQLYQLPHNKCPTAVTDEQANTHIDLSARFGRNEDGEWVTDFPPPPGFNGDESHDDWRNPAYLRSCTAEEVEVLNAKEAAEESVERAAEDALRLEWLTLLKEELSQQT